MGYAGYQQCLCKRGHLTIGYDGNCSICGEELVFFNEVNETNGDLVGLIPEDEWEKFLERAEVVKRCDLGHDHIVEHAIYRIPTPEEHRMMRHCLTYLADPDKDPGVRRDGLVRMETFDWEGAYSKWSAQ